MFVPVDRHTDVDLVPGDRTLVELAVADLHPGDAEVEDHRAVREPAAFGDVPHQPPGMQPAADDPGEPVPVNGGEGFGVVLPNWLIAVDT
jgi:hypothetical protein